MNGYELLRLIRMEYSLKTRGETIQARDDVLKTRISKYDDLPDLLRQLDAKLLPFERLLKMFPDPTLVKDISVQESDFYLLILKHLPHQCRNYV